MTYLNQANKIEITKEKYNWGIFRKISVGIDFSVIIHPENWQKIDGLKSGESLLIKMNKMPDGMLKFIKFGFKNPNSKQSTTRN